MISKKALTAKLKSLQPKEGQQHQHFSGLTYTAQVKCIVDHAQAHWLVDQIAAHQNSPVITSDPDLQSHQLWKLSVATDSIGVLRCYRDSSADLEPVIEKFVNPRGFPRAQLKLLLSNQLLSLQAGLNL
ncbi:MAG: DUF6876 family protein [Cyanobacteria bacterium P01_A01_bin.17]